MNKSIRYLLFMVAAISFNSCKKEDIQLARIVSTSSSSIKSSTKLNALIQESKIWYEQNSIQDGLRDEKIIIGTPDWSSSAVFKVATDLPEVIETPLKDYNVNYAFTNNMAPGGFRYLLLRKNASGKDFIADVIELHPDTAYINKRLEKHTNSTDITQIIKNEDFSGYFLVFTLKNILRYGELRKDGRAISILSL